MADILWMLGCLVTSSEQVISEFHVRENLFQDYEYEAQVDFEQESEFQEKMWLMLHLNYQPEQKTIGL